MPVKRRRAPRKPTMTYAGRAKTRNCLMCRTQFRSEGTGNWICKQCKATEAYRGSRQDECSICV